MVIFARFMNFKTFVLLPFGFLYGCIMALRNFFYDVGFFNSTTFSRAIISVGNLSVGGTGKTPHVEYLLKLLSNRFNVVTLSRGYGRKTKGFLMVNENSKATQVGDEPLQMFKKFKNIKVFVDEKRPRGITKINESFPETKAVILDDAFQHRSVIPGINILLTPYHNLYIHDFVLPAGRLREFKSGASRADVIVVTKTPKVFSPLERRIIYQDLKPLPHQKIFFSYLKYGKLIKLFQEGNEIQKIDKEFYFSRNFSCVLLTGIANADDLALYLTEKFNSLKHFNFPDHHEFSELDIQKVKSTFENLKSQNKIIVTTEKDATRLINPKIEPHIRHLPIFYITIEVKFHGTDQELFDEYILSYVGRN